FSRDQRMNFNYNPLHLVGSYGAFGSVTRRRHEIIVEGTEAPELSPDAVWQEYEFKGKPGSVTERPRQWAPYHLRLDWLMWFLPLSVSSPDHKLVTLRPNRWFLQLVGKLLESDPATLKLLRRDPFGGKPPTHIRAGFYLYQLN